MAKRRKAKKGKIRLNNFTKTLLILLLVLIVISIAPNYIKQIDDNQEIICLLNNDNINEKLLDPIRLDEYGNIYMSYEDVKSNLDNNIYIENDLIITTGNTSVARLRFNENKIKINGSDVSVLGSMYKDENEKIYIPVSELNNVYNIETSVINNIAIIRNLNNELIKYDARKNVDVKYKSTNFSKNVDKVSKGQKLIYVEKCNNSWVKVCTQNGIIGYVKEDMLTNKTTIRENMNYNTDETNTEGNIKEIDINNLDLSTYEKRENEVNQVLITCMKNGINMVKLNYQDDKNQNDIDRFYIELSPRLREIGIKLIK